MATFTTYPLAKTYPLTSGKLRKQNNRAETSTGRKACQDFFDLRAGLLKAWNEAILVPFSIFMPECP